MNFIDIKKADEIQISLCKKFGLDVRNDTASVAYAKLIDCLDKKFWKSEQIMPTEKQIELARKFDIDISKYSKEVGEAIISDIMLQLNIDSIKRQDLKPGDEVRYKDDKIGRILTISSIKEDGNIFFKGGNGNRAWARNVVKYPN